MALAVIDVEVRTGKSSADVKALAGDMGGLGKASDSVSSGLKVAGASILALGGAAVGVGAALASAAAASMRWADAVGISSAKTAMSTAAVQSFMHVAKQMDVEYGTLEKSITRMTLSLAKSPDAFLKLGVSVKDLRALAPEQQFAAIADKISALKSPTEQAAAASAIFGKSWAEIVPILREGGDRIRELAAENDRLGLSMSEGAIASGRDLDDTLTKLSEVWQGLIRNIGDVITTSEPVHVLFEGLVEILGMLSKGVQENTTDLRGFVDGGVILAAKGLQGLVTVVGFAIDMWTAFQIAVALANTVVEQSIIWAKAAAEAIMHPTRALAILKQAYTDQGAAAQRGIDTAKAEIQSNIDRHNKLILVSVAVDKLAKDVMNADGAVHKAVEGNKKHGASLGQTAAEIKKATAEHEKWILSLRHYGDGKFVGPTMADLTGQLQASFSPTQFAASIVPNMAKALNGKTLDLSGMNVKAPSFASTLGVALKAGFKDAMKDLPSVILGALQGGGDVGKSIGAHLGGSIGKSMEGPLTKGLTGVLGKTLGGALGALAPGLGSILGSLGGKLLGGLFGGGEGSKVNDLRDQFIGAAGGLDALRLKASEAGIGLERLLAAKKVTEFNAAMQELNSTMGSQAQMQTNVAAAHEAARAAAERYGLTVQERGPAVAMEELSKTAVQLHTDWEALRMTGADMSAVTLKMADDTNAYIQASKAAGQAIPEAMRGQIEALIAAGKLVDEHGNAYASAEAAGITYAQSMDVMFTTLLSKLSEWIDALNGIPTNKTTTLTIQEQHVGGGRPDDGGGKDGDPETPLASGTGGNIIRFPARSGGHRIRVAEAGRDEFLQVGHSPQEMVGAGRGGGITVNVRIDNVDSHERVRQLSDALSQAVRDGNGGLGQRIAGAGGMLPRV